VRSLDFFLQYTGNREEFEVKAWKHCLIFGNGGKSILEGTRLTS
jgi:hypothetical protein